MVSSGLERFSLFTMLLLDRAQIGPKEILDSRVPVSNTNNKRTNKQTNQINKQTNKPQKITSMQKNALPLPAAPSLFQQISEFPTPGRLAREDL